VRSPTLSQLHQRVGRVEIAVAGNDLLSEPVVHETTRERLHLTEFGIEVTHDDDKGYQLVPWQRVVRIDFRESE
jgi:hypothetical protein